MADSSFDLARWMAAFGYTPEWIDLKFIDAAFVREQAARFGEGADGDLERYKWAAYRKILDETDFSSRERWREFVRVIEADPNEHLYRGALAELLDLDRVPPDWLLEHEAQSARFISVPSVRKKIDLAVRRRLGKGENNAPMVSTRAASSADAAEAIELLRRSFVELCVEGHQNDEATLQAWLENKTTQRFARWLADPDTRVVVAESDAALRGVGSIHRSGEIRLCYVLPGFEARGIGKALLARLEEHARAWRLSSVHLASGVGSRAFYEHCGYQPSAPARPGFGISVLFPYAKALRDHGE